MLSQRAQVVPMVYGRGSQSHQHQGDILIGLWCEEQQELALVHHELEVVYDDSCLSEQHTATLLVLGETHYWDTELLQRPQSVMPHTVGLLPVAIAAKVTLDT